VLVVVLVVLEVVLDVVLVVLDVVGELLVLVLVVDGGSDSGGTVQAMATTVRAHSAAPMPIRTRVMSLPAETPVTSPSVDTVSGP
jgi:hypothetical protein